MERVSLEVQDGVDDVLEDFGAGNGPVFGDMAYHEDRRFRRFGLHLQPQGRLADL